MPTPWQQQGDDSSPFRASCSVPLVGPWGQQQNLILAARSDKQAEAEDYRKLGNKEKEKRQQDKKYSSTTAVRRRNLKGSGRAAQHFGGGLPGYTNPTPRSQFLPSVSELTPATRPCGRKCPGANTLKLFHM